VKHYNQYNPHEGGGNEGRMNRHIISGDEFDEGEEMRIKEI
jgi:hypothetical protein